VVAVAPGMEIQAREAALGMEIQACGVAPGMEIQARGVQVAQMILAVAFCKSSGARLTPSVYFRSASLLAQMLLVAEPSQSCMVPDTSHQVFHLSVSTKW